VWLVVKLNAANAGRLEKRLGRPLDWADSVIKAAE